jgi:hypothetical protein
LPLSGNASVPLSATEIEPPQDESCLPQFLPTKPLGHAHEYDSPFLIFVQIPLFLQGLDAHALFEVFIQVGGIVPEGQTQDGFVPLTIQYPPL